MWDGPSYCEKEKKGGSGCPYSNIICYFHCLCCACIPCRRCGIDQAISSKRINAKKQYYLSLNESIDIPSPSLYYRYFHLHAYDPVPRRDGRITGLYSIIKPFQIQKDRLRNNWHQNQVLRADKEGKATHTNAQMTALAVKALFRDNPEKIKDVELLSCGTSSPDQMMPSHAVMVHGWPPEAEAIEVVSPSGVCCAGYPRLQGMPIWRSGPAMSIWLSPRGPSGFLPHWSPHVFEEEAQKLKELHENPFIAFDKEFLRWMLSDGAAAFLLSDRPNDKGLSLRVEWIEGASMPMNGDLHVYGQ